jgi:heparin/heparan-sulfate lyase
LFSYFSADLRSAYSDKIKALTRSFCFLKMNSASTPACVIVLDDIHTADATFKKYWQVNTLQPPLPTTEGVQLHNSENGVTGRVNICMLRPAPEEWTREIKSGDEVFNVFGYKVTSPVPAQPEANGHRILFSPRNARVHDTFLALMQIHADGVKPLPYTLEEQTEYVTIRTGEWIVCMARDGKLIKKDFKITVPDDKKSYQVVLAGVMEGEWQIKSAEGLQEQNSIKGGHTLYLTASAGQCQFIAPGTAR